MVTTLHKDRIRLSHPYVLGRRSLARQAHKQHTHTHTDTTKHTNTGTNPSKDTHTQTHHTHTKSYNRALLHYYTITLLQSSILTLFHTYTHMYIKVCTYTHARLRAGFLVATSAYNSHLRCSVKRWERSCVLWGLGLCIRLRSIPTKDSHPDVFPTQN